MTENEISKVVFEECIKIHRMYGPGLFESVYEILCFEFNKLNLFFYRQKPIPVIHEGIKLEDGFRCDFIIENKVIVELKSVEKLADVHYKQLLTYLKLTNLKLGLLVNFNVALLKDGFHRIANNL